MKRFAVLIPSILLAGVLLSACGTVTLNSQQMQFELSPSHTLGYEVDSGGTITIQERTMNFRNSAGAHAATVTGYEITYYDGVGNEISLKGTEDDPPFTTNVFVPAGLTCDEPDPELGCTVFDEGWQAAPGPQVSGTPGNLLHAGVAQMHLDAWLASGDEAILPWRAEFVFHGVKSSGAEFVTTPYSVHIAPPN